MRTLLVQLCALLLRLFFRRIEVVGAHNVPTEGAVLFALNHPNGLLDPLFVLCFSGRRVSFLAKEPLFRMPVIGFFVRTFESLPVYRASDGADPKKNREMMDAAGALLAQGNALALFPEGTSHSDPTLKPFKTGAARMALGARVHGTNPVYLVPGALYFEEKQTFRSRAVLAFGPPIQVPLTELGPTGAPPPDEAHQLTKTLQKQINGIMPTADTVDDLTLAESAERIFSAALRDQPEKCPTALELDATFAGLSETDRAMSTLPSLGQRMTRRRRLLDGYLLLVKNRAADVTDLLSDVERLRDRLALLDLPVDAPHDHAFDPKRRFGRSLAISVLLSPLGLLGMLLHAPAYQLVRYIAFRYSGPETDVLATVKLLSGLLLFPLTWIFFSLLSGFSGGYLAFLVTLVFCPLLAWLTLIYRDNLGYVVHQQRLRRRTQSAPIDWPQIVDERSSLAERMAQLMTQEGHSLVAQERTEGVAGQLASGKIP